MYSILVVLINTILPELHLVGLLYIINNQAIIHRYKKSLKRNYTIAGLNILHSRMLKSKISA